MDHRCKYRFIGRFRLFGGFQNVDTNVYEWRCHACKSTIDMFVKNFWKADYGHGC